MLKRTLLSTAVLSAVALTGCNTDSNDDTNTNATPTPTPTVGEANVRVWHASPDAPMVNVYVNGNQVLANVDYRGISNWLTLPEGTHNVQVRGIVLNDEVTVIDQDVTDFFTYNHSVWLVTTRCQLHRTTSSCYVCDWC